MSVQFFQMKPLLLAMAVWLCAFTVVSAQWKPIEALPKEPFYALYSEGKQFYAATANRVYRSDDDGQTWTASALIHLNNDEVTDLLVVNGVIYASMVVNGCYVSKDGGQNWQQQNAGLVGLGAKNLSMLARRGDSIYVSTFGAGVFVKPVLPVSANWTAYNSGMPWGNVFSIVSDAGLLLAGAGVNATLSRHQLGQNAWEERAFDTFNGQINGFLGALRDGAVWLGGGQQGLYRSTNNGLSWTHFNPGVGLLERVRFASWQGQTVSLLGKTSKTFLRVTKDQGLSWSEFQPALPTGGLGYDLLNHGQNLFCARTDGLWILAPSVGAGEPEESAFSMGQIYPNPATGDFITIPFELHRAAEARLSLFDAQGRLLQQSELGMLPSGANTQRFSLQGLADGLYICILEINGSSQAQRLLLQR